MGIRLHARAINQRIFAVAETAKADRPLGSVRIVDLTSVIMGPFATHILADMRAESSDVRFLPERDASTIAQPSLARARAKRSATTPTSRFVAGPLTSTESMCVLKRKENPTWYRFRTMN
jgi:hypothetical protein